MEGKQNETGGRNLSTNKVRALIMKRKLLKQTRNEWRSNLWLAIELLIVSTVVWYICDYLYCISVTLTEPSGFTTERTYRLTLGQLSGDSPRFVDYGEDAAQNNAEDLAAVYDLIKERPEVEAASISAYAEPFNTSYMGNTATRVSDSLEFGVRCTYLTPGHIKVFDYQPVDPAMTQDDLVRLLSEGKVLLTDFNPDNPIISRFFSKRVTPAELIGSRLTLDDETYTVGALAQPIKRNVYESKDRDIVLLQPLQETNPLALAEGEYINIRLRPGTEKSFLESFASDRESKYRRANTYISDIKSYDELDRITNHHETVTNRKFIACMVFMLICVFLGLFGTFWFRTRQRVSEIAIRKVNGASNRSIFGRLVTEGLLLLVIVTPIAVILDWLICRYEFTVYFRGAYFETWRFVATATIAFALLALMIVAGIWYPARKAMKIDPAVALKDE